ncbi:hypothetical protein N7456_006895 [Penicillium angulare]|uniref:Uncharacterized protein n=1 Tax=Penicillium angulare TaxID=116970 RepID=A0A9W9KCE7_9EURO|nr:hypothetical protein N7456_006895 [Penicillium angulare]
MSLQPIFDVICIRFAIAFLIVIDVAIAGLDSAIARFAVVLRDRAKSDLAASGDSVVDNVFGNLMHRALISAILGALASTGLATFGIVLTVSSSRARQSHGAFTLFGLIQFSVSIGYVALGDFIADTVVYMDTNPHLNGSPTLVKFHITRSCTMVELEKQPSGPW